MECVFQGFVDAVIDKFARGVSKFPSRERKLFCHSVRASLAATPRAAPGGVWCRVPAAGSPECPWRKSRPPARKILFTRPSPLHVRLKHARAWRRRPAFREPLCHRCVERNLRRPSRVSTEPRRYGFTISISMRSRALTADTCPEPRVVTVTCEDLLLHQFVSPRPAPPSDDTLVPEGRAPARHCCAAARDARRRPCVCVSASCGRS